MGPSAPRSPVKVVLVNPPWVYKRLYTHGIYPAYGLLMVATLLASRDSSWLNAAALSNISVIVRTLLVSSVSG